MTLPTKSYIKMVTSNLLFSSGVKQASTVVIGNVLATGFSAISLILISRLLGPSSFGEFSVGIALIMIITRFNDLGLSTALTRFVGGSSKKTDIAKYVAVTFKFRLILSLLILLLSIFLMPRIVSLLKIDNPGLVWAAILFSFATVYYDHALSVLQSVHRFTQAVIANVIQAVTKLLAVLLLTITGTGSVMSYFSLYTLAPILSLLAFPFLSPSWLKAEPARMLKSYVSQRSDLIRVAKHSAIAVVSGGIIEDMGVLFVQGYLSSFETGLLGGVSRIALLFTLVAGSLTQVLYPRVARYKSTQHLNQYLKKAGILVCLIFAGFLAFLPFAKLSILLTIGPEYLTGLPILIILLGAVFIHIATIPFIALFYSFDVPWYFSVAGILQLIIALVGNIFFIPIFGLQAAAWTKLLSRSSVFLFTLGLGIFLYYTSYQNKREI